MSKINVILLKDIKNLGKRNDIISVSEGYASNFLLPKELAKKVNQGILNNLENEMLNDKNRAAKIKKEAQEKANLLENKFIQFFVKTSKEGKIFGAISNKDIELAIKEQLNVDVDKRKIEHKENIKHLGEENIKIKLHPDITVNIILSIKEEK